MTNLTSQIAEAEDKTMKAAAKVETYNLYEAKTALSRLVDQAAAGEEIIIAKAGKPMARLVPIKPAKEAQKKRDWDAGRDLFKLTYIAPDFDAPWTDEELDEMGF